MPEEEQELTEFICKRCNKNILVKESMTWVSIEGKLVPIHLTCMKDEDLINRGEKPEPKEERVLQCLKCEHDLFEDEKGDYYCINEDCDITLHNVFKNDYWQKKSEGDV